MCGKPVFTPESQNEHPDERAAAAGELYVKALAFWHQLFGPCVFTRGFRPGFRLTRLCDAFDADDGCC